MMNDDTPSNVTGTPVLKAPDTLGRFYRHLFGTEDWGDADSPPPYHSGPVPRSAGSLAQRRLADPEARFHYAVMMAHVMLLPICVARDARERDALNGEIAEILGLDTAARRGWIDGWTIAWRHGKYPRSPTGIRVRTGDGRRTRSQVLGALEPHIRRFIERAKLPPDNTVHLLGGRRIG